VTDNEALTEIVRQKKRFAAVDCGCGRRKTGMGRRFRLCQGYGEHAMPTVVVNSDCLPLRTAAVREKMEGVKVEALDKTLAVEELQVVLPEALRIADTRKARIAPRLRQESFPRAGDLGLRPCRRIKPKIPA